MWRHLMPNTIAPLIVQGTYVCASAILTEAILSFLGAGISPETPTWGNIMIAKDQAKSYEIMGADVKQSGEQFGNSAKYLRWQDKAANQKFFAGDFLTFNKDAAELLLEVGIIKAAPKVEDIYDASFIK